MKKKAYVNNHLDADGKYLRKNKIDRYLYSPVNIIVWAVLTFSAFVCSVELIYYSLITAYAIFVIAFCYDFVPIMPLFTLCYVIVSKENNPGIYSQGIFSGESANYILSLAGLVIVALCLRVSFDKSIGWKVFIKKKRVLLPGIVVLGLSYLLSGIRSSHYLECVKQNLIFAFIQVAALSLLYVVFSATVKWERFDVDYFATIGLMTGIVVVFELIWIYISQDVIVHGTIVRSRIWTGWGVYNNIGAMIALAIPFAFYFACKKRNSGMYLLLAMALMGGVIFSCSRGSIVCAVISFLISFIYTFIHAEHKKNFRVFSGVLCAILVVGGIMYIDSLKEIFKRVPDILDMVDGEILLNDSGRTGIYVEGWKAFLNNPIFGQSFYSIDYKPPDFSELEAFSSFFPARWHNTIIQMMASCGSVGLLAYLFHRYQTIRLFMKKRTTINSYIGIYILTLLCLSMVDCHFFNVGPTLFYSMALAVMEYGTSKCQVNANHIKNIPA